MRSSSSTKLVQFCLNFPCLLLHLDRNSILNDNFSSINNSSSSSISRRPTSALSKIGKHVPPPIKSLKSSSNTSAADNISTSGTSVVSLDKKEIECSETVLKPASPSCAWRKVTESVTTTSTTTTYPQRKIPSITPEVAVNVEPEKPKSFLERFEDFPNLLKQQQQQVNTTSATSTLSLVSTSARPTTKLLGGDFNFLEDDDWLDGDNIDYSQNLFEDSEHFLPSIIITSQPKVDHESKAKSLLEERQHSTSKKDIWKRTEEGMTGKTKIRILKRSENTEKDKKDETSEKLVKKFTTALKIADNIKTVNDITTTDHIKTDTAIVTPITSKSTATTKSKTKFVYSSTSKTLQKNILEQ